VAIRYQINETVHLLSTSSPVYLAARFQNYVLVTDGMISTANHRLVFSAGHRSVYEYGVFIVILQ